MLDTTLDTEVQGFLDEFGGALERGDIDAAVAMFLTDCYWRDLVTFTWNIRTLEGPDQVRDMLTAQLGSIKPGKWRIADNEPVTEDGGITTAWITFETDAHQVGGGKGHAAPPLHTLPRRAWARAARLYRQTTGVT